MCQLGELTNNLLTKEPIVGYRGWYIKDIKNNGKELFPINQNLNIPFDKNMTKAILCPNANDIHFIGHECGLYSYNNNNNYNNNYNYNYNYNYNSYYINYYYNYNSYYNYNNNYYYVAGKIEHSGKIAHHKLGYRSTFGKPILLVKLTPKKGLDDRFQEFLEHFNSIVQKTADYYGCETINHEDFK